MLLGFFAGANETDSNRLHIANNSGTSLIYGEFDNEVVQVNGKLNIRDVINLTALATPPGSPVTGDIYLDDGSCGTCTGPTLRYYNGTIWSNL